MWRKQKTIRAMFVFKPQAKDSGFVGWATQLVDKHRMPEPEWLSLNLLTPFLFYLCICKEIWRWCYEYLCMQWGFVHVLSARLLLESAEVAGHLLPIPRSWMLAMEQHSTPCLGSSPFPKHYCRSWKLPSNTGMCGRKWKQWSSFQWLCSY